MEKEKRKNRAPDADHKRFVKLDVHEVSFVDDGANEEEQFLTVKRKQNQMKKEIEKMGDLFEEIFGSEGTDDGGTPPDGGTDETEKLNAGKVLSMLKQMHTMLTALGKEVVGESDYPKPSSMKKSDKADDETETDKAKRLTGSRLAKIKEAYASLGELIAEIEANPATIMKQESDKLRGEMKKVFEEFGAKLAAIEKKFASDDADKSEDAESDDDGKEKKEKKKTEKAETKTDSDSDDDGEEETEKADSRETPDDGEEETDKSKTKQSPFRGFFGGTHTGRQIEKRRRAK